MCIGLLSSCAEYFNRIFPKLSHRVWVIIMAVVSYLISILGLDAILKISTPILNALYPMAIILILLGLANKLTSRIPLCYPVGIAFTGVVSVLDALTQVFPIPGLVDVIHALPLYDAGFVWLIPAIVGTLIGAIASFIKNKKSCGQLLLPAEAEK